MKLVLRCWKVLLVLAISSCSSSTQTPDARPGEARAGDVRAAEARPPGAEAGPDVRADLPAPQPPKPRDPVQVARAALLFSSCIPDDKPNQIASNFFYEPLRVDVFPLDGTAIDCLAKSTAGCAAIETCLGVKVKADLLCTPGYSCNGQTAVICGDGLRGEIDCARQGAHCYVGRCVKGADPAACDDLTFTETCEAGHPRYCSNGYVKAGPYCADLALDCALVDGSSGTFACIGKEGSCKATKYGPGSVDLEQGLSCSAGQLTVCVNNGKKTVSCSDLGNGLSCQAVNQIPFCGLASECDPSDKTRECVGSSVKFCSAGKRVTVDCASLGFTSCLPVVQMCGPGAYGG